ncbi:hypothetical protein CW304_12515 [Bacillus sp. UFRGS-B20]|nr:hypothetical protein CW304_12515 [Bacillus sp. UFRGS-B20]
MYIDLPLHLQCTIIKGFSCSNILPSLSTTTNGIFFLGIMYELEAPLYRQPLLNNDFSNCGYCLSIFFLRA